MSYKPKISIVTCTYNSEKYLKKCLKSLEKQTYKNIEHIFNDSYSSDNTLKIINRYIDRNKEKYPIKVIQTPPKGVGDALNNAYEHCTGDIVHFLHGDVYYNDSIVLERVVKYFDNNPNKEWVTGNFFVEVNGTKIVIPHTPLLKVAPKKMMSVMNIIHHENTFVKTYLISKYGGFNEKKYEVVEYGLWLRIIEDHLPLIVNDQFTVFIIHKGSTSTGSVIKFSKAILRAFNTQHTEKVFPFIGPYEDKHVYKSYKKLLKSINLLKKKFPFDL